MPGHLLRALPRVASFAPVVALFVAESDFNPLYPLLGFTLAAMVLGSARHFLRANPDGVLHAVVIAGLCGCLDRCHVPAAPAAALPLLITGGA